MSIQKITFKSENNAGILQQFSPMANTIKVSAQNEQPAKETPESKAKSNKKIQYISFATAAAAIGISGIIAYRQGKFAKVLKEQTKSAQEMIKELKTSVAKELSEQINSQTDTINETLAKTVEKEVKAVEETLSKTISANDTKQTEALKDLGKWQDGQIDGLKKDLSERIDHLVTTAKSTGAEEIILQPVNVNGLPMELAGVMHGYGKYTEKLEKELQTEATKRIFGLVDRSGIIPKDDVMIRVPTSEFSGFTSTGGMSVVPKEVIANLGALVNNKQKIRLTVDTPLYLGQVQDKVYYSIVKNKNGKYNYISSDNKKVMAELEKLDSKLIPIYTDKGKIKEDVEIYIARNLEQEVDLNLLKERFSKDFLAVINEKLKHEEPFENDILKISYDTVKVPDINDPNKKIEKKYPISKIKYDAIFYKNDKFRMDGPVVSDSAKTIYNNLTHAAGETERNIYFDKYFYEYLLSGAETSNENLRADLIIGNDWQTGGISAMVRLLTLAKKYFGLDPQVANKIYNTPIVTIIHNAGLSGEVWHSQAKLLNILFDEHSAKIVQNAYMPKNTDLPPELLNGLFYGNKLNPQTMASVYSDTLIPVSVGNGAEMATHSGFGGANHQIFRMRGRYHEFADIQHIKYIARMNGIDDTLAKENNITYRPITNGSDKINNTFKNNKKLEEAVGLKPDSLKIYHAGDNILEWHNHNKEAYLNKVIEEVKLAREGVRNVMNIELPEMTNLDGVTKDTMVVSTAGRIADQKGLDIFAEAIDEFISRHPNEDLPVFYAQGVGDQVYIDALMNVKRRIAQKWGEKAAERIVFARVFSEPGLYDGCKLMSDFISMSCWYEPCGLVHKQIANYSGAIPIVNKVGGLTDGLQDGVNAIFANFKNKYDNYQDALDYNRKEFANALDRAWDWFKDKDRLAKGFESSLKTDHSWLAKDGPIEKYAKVFVDLKVLKPEVLD